MMWKYVNFVIAWVGWKFYNAGNSHLTFEGIILIYRWWATSRTTNHRLLVRVHRDRRCRRWSLFMGAGWQSHCLCSKRKEATKSQKSQLTNTHQVLKTQVTHDENRPAHFDWNRKVQKWTGTLFSFLPSHCLGFASVENEIELFPTSLGFSPTLFSNLVGMFWACNQQQWIDHIHLFELSLHTKQSVQYYMYAHINK